MNVLLTLLFHAKSIVRQVPHVENVCRSVLARIRPEAIVIYGNKIYLDPADELLLSVFGTYEPLETELFKRSVKKGDTVVDVGAHIGYYTLLASKLVGPRGRVCAFEPEKTRFDLLKKNIQANHFRNVEPKRIVLGARTSLDKFVRGRVDVVKIDTDGHEVSVLRGMKRILSTNNEIVLFVEYWPHGLQRIGQSSGKELLALLQWHRFFVYVIHEKRGLDHTNLMCVRKPLSAAVTRLGVNLL